MKTQLRNALEIKAKGGAVLISDWTTGYGKHTSRRAIPPFCEVIAASPRGMANLCGETLCTARKIIRQHPRSKHLVCLVDRRGLNAALNNGSD